jgi:seryl-tRNA synthetase
MIDPKLLRNDLKTVCEKLQLRGFTLNIDKINELEDSRKITQVELQLLQNEKNIKSKRIGTAKQKGEDITVLLSEVSDLGYKLGKLKFRLVLIEQKLNDIQFLIPNIPQDGIPVGNNEDDNIEVVKWGIPRAFSFEPKEHTDLGTNLKDGLDFEAGAKLSGARFVVMHGKMAKLHRALAQFMLETHTGHGYSETYVPYLVSQESLFGTGQLPKFSQDLFNTNPLTGQSNNNDAEKRQLSLIPTAEVPLTNLARDVIFDESELPIKLTAHTPCFRSEAGSHGRDTKGLIRQHQFDKVELVQFVKPEDSDKALEQLTGHAEKILQLLELPYRKVILCTGDMGFSAQKTYDLEVWLPGQDAYREISSCSSMGDFQARRMKARFRRKGGKPELIHTLNGSGLAVGRTLVAILENYQNEDGSITIPEALVKYMNCTKI